MAYNLQLESIEHLISTSFRVLIVTYSLYFYFAFAKLSLEQQGIDFS